MSKVDILAVAKQAQLHKLENANVIDATIGMFYDEQNSLVIEEVKNAFYNVDIETVFKYGPTQGNQDFKDNAIKWVLDDKYEKLSKKFIINSVLTPGGSGAISIIFNSYGKINDKVLVPTIRWRYDYFTNANHKQLKEFNLFDNNKFDLKDFELKLNELSKKQEEIIVVINDPCHNPTGYQLTDSEWISIIDIVNKFKNNKIIIAYDIAYIDYHPDGYKASRKPMLHLLKLEKHVEVLIAFSGSKTFGLYGIRLGGLISLQHTKEQEAKLMFNSSEDSLGKWSSPSSLGPAIFNQIIENKKDYIVTLENLTSMLKARGEIFINEAQSINLETYPYKGGFFILIKTQDVKRDFNRLKDNLIYTIPMDEGLRIALCSININEVYGLAKRIKDIISQ